MFQIGQKVKYVGHMAGCVFCFSRKTEDPWVHRVGKLALYIGTPGRVDPDTVKVHFDGEDGPCFTYLSHLDKA